MLATKKQGSSNSGSSNDPYDAYRVKSIQLLNELMICPKETEKAPGSKPNPDITNGTDAKKEPKIEPNKSSTPLQHNGNVGGLEDLILFLIKSPTTLNIQTKLKDVYNIFNPNARDILMPTSSSASIPTPTPATPAT